MTEEKNFTLKCGKTQCFRKKCGKVLYFSGKKEVKSVYLIATRDLSNLWLQFFLSQNQGFMRLFEKTVLK